MAGSDTSIWGAGVEEIPGPQGDQGPVGPAPELVVGTVTKAVNPSFVLTETAPGVYRIDIELPKGDKGDPGNPGGKGDPGDPGTPGVIQTVGDDGSTISVDSTDPAHVVVSVSASYQATINGKVGSVSAGTGIDVDNTNPTAPVVTLNARNRETLFVKSAAADPTTSDIPAGEWRVWNNTAAGTVKLIANIGGTLKSVELT